MAPRRSLDELKQTIRSCPIIDNHAHNILRHDHLAGFDLLTSTTEASGDALAATPSSLSHLRAARQLKELYGLPTDATWSDVVHQRTKLIEEDADTLTGRCLEGTETILIDDGLVGPEQIEAYNEHDRFTSSPCKRIVRIETVAADLLRNLHHNGDLPVGIAIADEEACSLAWVSFVTAFEEAIAESIRDADVVGFKSVVCYRTGLQIDIGSDAEIAEDGLRSFRKHFLPNCISKDFRVETKHMNDALVISTCKLIAAAGKQGDKPKPLQFHTGLGDDDIDLIDSNPACLQDLIAAFPTVPIVLLHTSYPYTRQAGYLATCYSNVYLDLGEAFPMVSRDGQEHIIRQSMELTPTSKLLWSTDGHFAPETYWLANIQGRAVIEKILLEYVSESDLTVDQAIEAAEGIFFTNSNKLYNLGLKLAKGGSKPSGQVDNATAPALSPSHVKESGVSVSSNQAISDFRGTCPETKYIYIQWLDYMAMMRTRCVPIAEFANMIEQDRRMGVSYGNLGTLQNDSLAPVCNPVGQIFLAPDLSTLNPMWPDGPVKHAATVTASFVDADHLPVALCPRTQFQRQIDVLHTAHNIDILIGFEIEVTFCRRITSGTGYEPLDTDHAWATLNDTQYLHTFPLLHIIANALQDINVPLQQFHSEAGAGQYEFVLSPLPAVNAVDTLIRARQCIQQVAATHNLRATFHPAPFSGIGTAAHAHFSLNPTPSNTLTPSELDNFESSFIAGILDHLPALQALMLPQDSSYSRVADSSWTCGKWVAWGTQNREVPLRKSGERRWEVRCLDGFANLWLALGGVFAAGLVGVKEGKELRMGDCRVDPARLDGRGREELGIERGLCGGIDEALESLLEDVAFQGAMGDGVVDHYVQMKRAELEMTRAMEEGQPHKWLIERY